MKTLLASAFGAALVAGLVVSSWAAKNGGAPGGDGGAGACQRCDCLSATYDLGLPPYTKCDCVSSDGFFGWGSRECDVDWGGPLGDTCKQTDVGPCSSTSGGTGGGYHP